MANLPAKSTSNAVSTRQKTRARRLIRILEDDHNFDIVKELVDLYHRVKKARVKPLSKYKMEFQILQSLLQYAYPKLQAIESDTKVGDNISFNITIPTPTPKKPDKVKGVVVDATKTADGSFQVRGKK